jgi:serine/threonine protein kinase
MTQRVNPFITRRYVPPTRFIGREEIINSCRTWLASKSSTSFYIHGEHGIGKTSLLHRLRYLADEQDWGGARTQLVFIHLDCQEIQPFTPTRFWQRVLFSLRRATDKSILHKELDDLLQEPELDSLSIGYKLFDALNQQQISLVLMLDSFTWIIDCYSDEPRMIGHFLISLRSLTNQANSPLIIVTATPKPLEMLCAHIEKDYPGSRFYNTFMSQPLGPFGHEEIEDLFVQAQDLSGFDFNADIKTFLVNAAGPHPALLQMAGFHLFEACPDNQLTETACRKVIRELEDTARSYFTQFWADSSALERTLLVLVMLNQLLQAGTIRSTDVALSREEILGFLNTYERDLIQIERRALVRAENETYGIASAVFAQWIVHDVSADSEAIYAQHDKAIRDKRLLEAWDSLIGLAPQLTLDPAIPMLAYRAARDPDKLPPVPTRFQIEQEIGRGASSIVYKAIDSRLGRTVAIKALHSHLTDSPDVSRRRLLKEAQAASKLQHPNIVTVFDAIEVDESVWMVMEHMQGQTLADLLHEQGTLPLEQVIIWLEQAAGALDYAHQQGVIHRDIKPANLMLADNDTLKLADFGIAKDINAPHTTQEGEFKGTVTYMSPEQVSQESLDGRSDLFSLASVAFEMLTGHSPWPDLSVLGIMNNIEEAKARPLSEFDVPGALVLEPIFRKAMAKNRDDRYPTCQAFVGALKRAHSYVAAYGTGKRWALLVGIDTYDDEHHYGKLRLCVRDVYAIRQQLEASGFEPDRMRVLTDELDDPPTREHILTTLKSLADNTEPNDLLLFYYSGHGDTVDDESYLVARNSQRLVLSDTGVRLARIKDILEEAPARAKVIVLDACHSGANIKGIKGGEPMPADFLRRVFEEAEGMAIMASCKQGQVSYEWKELEGSVFTHYLLEALAGQADREEKGFVTVQDVNQHVSDRVKLWASQHNVSQTPTLQYSVAGDIVLAFYR